MRNNENKDLKESIWLIIIPILILLVIIFLIISLLKSYISGVIVQIGLIFVLLWFLFSHVKFLEKFKKKERIILLSQIFRWLGGAVLLLGIVYKIFFE